MQKNKKGVSGVIVALIMILVALVATGVIWVVVRNVTESGRSSIELGAKCLDSVVTVTAATCTAVSCSVTVKRDSGTDEVDGIRIVVSDGSNSDSYDTGEDIVTPNIATHTVTLSNAATPITSVEASVYFNDDKGTPYPCSASTFTNIVNP
jgi:flagellin-like protein